MTNIELTPGTNAMVFGAMVQLVFALYFILEGSNWPAVPLILMIGATGMMQRATALSYNVELNQILVGDSND